MRINTYIEKFITLLVVMIIAACSSKIALNENNTNNPLTAKNVRSTKNTNSTLPIRACTQIGCFDTIAILLPKNLINLPGEYRMEIGLDNDEIRQFHIAVHNARSCEQDSLKPLKITAHDSVWITLNSELCQNTTLKGATRVDKFTGINLLNVIQKRSLVLKIKNLNGQYILQKNIDLQNLPTENIEPNGAGCGGCKKQIINLR